jgi:hypothetical protein
LLKDLGVTQFITKPSGLDQFLAIGTTIMALLAASAQTGVCSNGKDSGAV